MRPGAPIVSATGEVDESLTKLTEQFRVQYCGKGVSMASRYYHVTKHVDQTPFEYIYRHEGEDSQLRWTPEEKREHAEHFEHFINILGVQELELASPLTLMEVPDTATFEKKLRARQHALVHQMKTLFGSNLFRLKAPTPTPAMAVHAV
ncbi:LOW QUALITY PROTEIN: Eukaryotic/viral aspartic protease [Phytophthora megakarya]|uniref:Eukaryotic/viral aspartic protease n=1 Tax=Phytophthora megakarya TaxID=4795 RepID=A0A225X1C1_9STRA|nr:LOW QUALITY PROTEIN: Eukaryotic/viral aspartic protease [Phytophthora megakarya]